MSKDSPAKSGDVPKTPDSSGKTKVSTAARWLGSRARRLKCVFGHKWEGTELLRRCRRCGKVEEIAEAVGAKIMGAWPIVIRFECRCGKKTLVKFVKRTEGVFKCPTCNRTWVASIGIKLRRGIVTSTPDVEKTENQMKKPEEAKPCDG